MSNNKIAERLLTIDHSSPVLCEYVYYNIQNNQFYDPDNDVLFVIIDYERVPKEHKNANFIEIIVAKENYPVVIVCKPDRIDQFLDVKFSDLVKSVWGKEEFEKDRNQWNDLSQFYFDLKEWDYAVTEIVGQDYSEFFDNEIIKSINKIESFVADISKKLHKRLMRSYFDYHNSTILDLSIINDVDCFVWDAPVYVNTISFEDIKEFFETF